MEPVFTPELNNENDSQDPDENMLSTMEIIEEQVESLRGLSLSNEVI